MLYTCLWTYILMSFFSFAYMVCEVDCITVLGFLHSEFQIVYYFTSCKFTSSALILLVWQQKEHLPYRKSILSQQLPGVCLRTFG